MKRIKQLLFIGSLLLTCSAFSQNAPVTAIASTTACPGDTVSLDVTVTSFTSIVAYSLRADYDSTKLSFIGFSNWNTTLVGANGNNVSILGGTTRKILAGWFDAGFIARTIPDNSVLFTLNFVYKAGAGTATIAFNNTDNGGQDCEYADATATPLNDNPTATYYINGIVSLGATPPLPGSITGSSTPCNGISQTYSISPVGGATSYTWSYSGTPAPSGTGTSVTFTPTSDGILSVTANNACGSSTPQTISITINSIPAQPGTINGNGSFCSGTSQNYSIVPVSGATAYTWSYSGTPQPSGTGDNVTFTPATSGTLSVTADNACGSSSPQTLVLTVNSVPLQPGAITGNSSPCSGTSQNYSITPVGGATTYTWSYSGTPQPSGTGDNVTFTPATSGTLSVTADNVCGSSSPQTLVVTVNSVPSQPGVITGNNSPCSGTSQNYGIATVSGAITYTWSYSGTPQPSGTGTSVTFSPTTNGTLSVTANNACGSSSAQTLALTISNVPSQPGAIAGTATFCSGTTQNYSITPVSGATAYTWSYSGTPQPTGTGASTSFSPTSSGQLVVTANNNCGPSSPQTLNLTVNPQTIINTHPQDQFGAIGTTVTFSVTASGDNLTYQWQDSCTATGWGDIPSATSNAYSFTSDTSHIGCKYRCVITGTCGAVTSQSAVYSPLDIIITQNPVSQTVCEGDQVVFTVAAVGPGTLTYQWEKDCGSGFAAIAGATSTSYTISTATAADNGCLYRCVVSNGTINNTSSSATLTVNLLVQVNTQPQPINTCDSVQAVFTVSTANVNTYQWQYSPDLGTTWNDATGINFSGENTDTLTINPVIITNNGYIFRCELTGACDTVLTNEVTLTVADVLLASVSISANPSNIICEGTNVTLAAVPQNGGASPVFHWYLNNSLASATGTTYNNASLANNDSVYCVLISSDVCVQDSAKSNTVTMQVDAMPTVNAGNDTSICEGSGVTLVATGGPPYLWSNGLTTASITVTPTMTTTTYTVSVTNGACVAQDEIVVTLTECGNGLNVNAFTPNGDDINDIFMRDVDLKVFNRWGLELYSGTDGWDGKYKGKDVAPGTYFFVAKILDDNGNVVEVIKSSVVVIR